MAKDASDAIKKEKSVPADDVWLDDDWKVKPLQDSNGMGFNK